MLRVVLLVVMALGAAGCAGDPKPSPDGPRSPDPERGRRVYLSTCIACHASNPEVDGPLGPPVKGASVELLRARIVDGTYPPGYTPKRTTQVMKPLPQVADAVEDLAAYLAEP